MIRKSVYTATAVVLLALGSVSCSSDDEPAKPKVTASPSVKEVSPAADNPSGSSQKGSAPTRKQGATQYLELVAPFNKELDKCLPVLNPVLESGSAMMGEVSKVRKSCSGVGSANRTFAEELSKAKWPAEAEESVGQLVDELHADQLAWDEIGKAKSLTDLLEPEYPLTEDGPAAGLVRAHLGLPPVEEIEE